MYNTSINDSVETQEVLNCCVLFYDSAYHKGELTEHQLQKVSHSAN